MAVYINHKEYEFIEEMSIFDYTVSNFFTIT